jgi:hypothetical protein
MITVGEYVGIGDLGQQAQHPRHLPGSRLMWCASDIYGEQCPGGLRRAGDDPFGYEAGFFGLNDLGIPGHTRVTPGSEYAPPQQAVANVGGLTGLGQLGQLEGLANRVFQTALGGGLAYLLIRGATAERKQGWKIAGYVAGGLLGLSALGVALGIKPTKAS